MIPVLSRNKRRGVPLISKAVIYKKPDASTAAAARSVPIEMTDIVPLESVP